MNFFLRTNFLPQRSQTSSAYLIATFISADLLNDIYRRLFHCALLRYSHPSSPIEHPPKSSRANLNQSLIDYPISLCIIRGALYSQSGWNLNIRNLPKYNYLSKGHLVSQMHFTPSLEILVEYKCKLVKLDHLASLKYSHPLFPISLFPNLNAYNAVISLKEFDG